VARRPISNNLTEKLVASVTDKKDKEEIRLKTRFYLKNQISNYSPSERGEKLIIPQLCLDFEGNTQLAEPELYLDKNGWNLLDYSTILTQDEFSINEQAKQYTVDINEKNL
jgi:type III restriction enzyme